MSETEDGSITDALTTVASGGVLVFGGKVVALGLGFLTQLVMARWLDPSGYGTVILALSIISLAAMVAQLGLGQGVMRKYPKHEGDPAKVHGVISAGLRIGVISGVLIGAGLFIVAPIIATRVFDTPSLTTLLRVGALGIPFTVVGTIAISLARGARNARPMTYVNHLIRPAARFLFIASFLLAGFGIVGAVGGQIAALILGGILGLVFAYRTLPSWRGPVDRLDKSVLTFSIPLIAMQGTNFLISNTDTYLIGYYLQSSQVGIYNIAYQLRNLVIVVIVAAGFLLPPVLTQLEANDQIEELRRTYQITTKWAIFFTLPVFLTFVLLPEAIIRYTFGVQYTDGAMALQILAVGGLLSLLAGACEPSLIGLGKNRTVFSTTAIAAFVNIVLNIRFIPIYGIEGAALASTIAIALLNVMNTSVLYRNFDIIPLSANELYPITLALAVGGVCYMAVKTSGVPALGALTVWAGLYLPIFIRFGGVTIDDKRLFVNIEEKIGMELTIVRYLFRILEKRNDKKQSLLNNR